MGVEIDVADHDFQDAGDLSGVGQTHLLDVVDALVVVVDNLTGDGDDVSCLNFTQVRAMGFQREEAVVGGFHVIGAKAESCEHLVGGAVKEYAVIGHVEVAVVVYPLAFDSHGAGDMGCGFGHRRLVNLC